MQNVIFYVKLLSPTLISLCIEDGTLKTGDSTKNRNVHNHTERFDSVLGFAKL